MLMKMEDSMVSSSSTGSESMVDGVANEGLAAKRLDILPGMPLEPPRAGII